jgi:hypothetical protein
VQIGDRGADHNVIDIALNRNGIAGAAIEDPSQNATAPRVHNADETIPGKQAHLILTRRKSIFLQLVDLSKECNVR